MSRKSEDRRPKMGGRLSLSGVEVVGRVKGKTKEISKTRGNPPWRGGALSGVEMYQGD